MNPARGQVWRHKKTKREAQILCYRPKDYAPGWSAALDFRYLTPNPNSCATLMTRGRRMTVPMGEQLFLRQFEFVR